MRYLTNVALVIKGDRVEKGTQIELSAEEAARFDNGKDITLVSDIETEAPAPELASVPLSEMTFSQLKDRAKELGLSTSGSKADLQERITLHLSKES